MPTLLFAHSHNDVRIQQSTKMVALKHDSVTDVCDA